jgi:4-amino-4-deoxy-L-arabinose transferase-like glycosyltransferase
MEGRFRVAFWVALGLAALILLASLGSAPLKDPDEARFARTSIEMLQARDPVVPRFEGEPRLVKPPLLHWVQAALFSLFGFSSWAARLPAALATLVSIFLLGAVVRRRFGAEGAFWTVVVLATTPLVVILGRLGNIDALLALHVLAVICLDLAWPEQKPAGVGWAMGALLGLAFLCKGPVGVIVPLLVILAGRTATRRELLPSWHIFLSVLGGWAVVVLPWALALISSVGGSEVMNVLRTEVLDRYVSGTTHVEPPWFYLLVIAVGFLPWQAPLVIGVVRVVRRYRDPGASTALYAAAGLLAGLVFFSLGKGKLPNYILPLAPLCAIIVAWELGQELHQPRRRTMGPALLAATLGAFAIGLGVGGWQALDGVARAVAFAGAGIYGAGMLACLPSLVQRRPRSVYAVAAICSAVFLFVGGIVLMPALATQHSAEQLVHEVPALRSDRPIVIVDMRVPSLTLYLDRVPERIKSPQLRSHLDRDDAPLFVFADVDLPHIPEEDLVRLREIGRYAKFRVYEKR